jgi:para-aminobenzoate synthetase component 1
LGGWIGYVAYEAGLGAERLAPQATAAVAFPWARFGLYDSAALFDHDRRQWYLVAADLPEIAGSRRASASERLARLADWLLHAPGAPIRTPYASGEPSGRTAVTPEAPAIHSPAREALTLEPRPDWTWDEYAARVAVAKDYIAAGDIYQVNLTQRFVTETSHSPLELYLGLRRENPADYAALLTWPEGTILSSSPELFLEVRDGSVHTRPIKGTRPRTGDPVLDPIRRDRLAASPKDRAELNMIIDLLRNDLGKVCAVGSVRVER